MDRAAPRASEVSLRLPYVDPFDWDGLLRFLAPRATPGVEQVQDGVYRRTIAWGGAGARIEVAPRAGAAELEVAMRVSPVGAMRAPPRAPVALAERLGDLFDLHADPRAILGHLRRDALLRPYLSRCGVRVPGAWDGFELAVRAVLGQQVTVRGATTLAGRLAARFGRRLAAARPGEPELLFPEPGELADADVGSIGLPSARARALRALARAAADDRALLDPRRDAAESVARLRALPGIGAWTAQYVAMRALRDPDAFPAGDLGLRRALGDGVPLPESRLLAHAERWRPWRAYAAMAIWSGGGG